MKRKTECSAFGGTKEETAYAYLLLCADGSYYCGYTTEPKRRLQAHNSGKGAKYTRSRGPCTLVYIERCASKRDALRREWEIKQLTHREKEALIRDGGKA